MTPEQIDRIEQVARTTAQPGQIAKRDAMLQALEL